METSTQIGQIIGNYRITERISGGSFGSVYREALVAYNQAIALDPNDPAAYTGKGLALEQLQRTKRL